MWNKGDSPEAFLYRTILALKLPAQKRTAPMNTNGESRSMCYGLTVGRDRQPYVPSMPLKVVDVAKRVRGILRTSHPTFTFTSLQISVNCRSSLHVYSGAWVRRWRSLLDRSMEAIFASMRHRQAASESPHRTSGWNLTDDIRVLYCHMRGAGYPWWRSRIPPSTPQEPANA